MSKETAYTQGQSSARSGKPSSANPYKTGSLEHYWWFDGYTSYLIAKVEL